MAYFRSTFFLTAVLIISSNAFTSNGRLNGWGPATASGLRAKITDQNTDEQRVKTVDILSLDSIRSTLIRQEETIIFALIERAQFRCNNIIYQRDRWDLGIPLGSTPLKGETSEPLSFLEYMIVGTEVLHCGVRRYTSPEEHAFFPDRLPKGPLDALSDLDYPTELLSSVGGASSINFNPILLKKYIERIIPEVAKSGDDEQHGSTVVSDTFVLQALSRRVHYGKFVAESKYQSDPETYQSLVDAGDAAGVMKLLTNQLVEDKVLNRARLKAATYGREPLVASIPSLTCSDTTSIVAAAAASAVVAAVEALGDEKARKQGKIDPAVIENIYKNFIIPLTKDVEVAYLFLRCGKEPPVEYGPNRMSTDLTDNLMANNL